MEHACKRCACAVFDGGGGSCNGTRGGKSSKEGGEDVRTALTDQLLVGIKGDTGHACGHCCGKEAFDRAKEGDHQGGDDQRRKIERGDVAKIDREKACGDLSVARADGGDLCSCKAVQKKGSGGAENERNKCRGDLFADARQANHTGKPQNTDKKGRKIKASDIFNVRHDLLDRFCSRSIKSTQILDLSNKERDADACCKADGDRVREEAHDVAGTQKSEQDQNNTCQNACDRKPENANAWVCEIAVQDHDKGGGRTADLVAASADRRDEKSCNDGGDDAVLNAARGYLDRDGLDAKGNGERECNDGNHQTRHHVAEKILARVLLKAGENRWLHSRSVPFLIACLMLLLYHERERSASDLEGSFFAKSKKRLIYFCSCDILNKV